MEPSEFATRSYLDTYLLIPPNAESLFPQDFGDIPARFCCSINQVYSGMTRIFRPLHKQLQISNIDTAN
jgi:hypothetical protein